MVDDSSEGLEVCAARKVRAVVELLLVSHKTKSMASVRFASHAGGVLMDSRVQMLVKARQRRTLLGAQITLVAISVPGSAAGFARDIRFPNPADELLRDDAAGVP